MGLWPAETADGRSPGLALPFALERAEAVAATPTTAYAWIRHRPGGAVETTAARLDVTVVDERGRVCVELTGLSTRHLRDSVPAAVVGGEGAGLVVDRAVAHLRRVLASALKAVSWTS
ncbi:hypothetical protein SVIOM74S_04192 [Streptomyces violarus]